MMDILRHSCYGCGKQIDDGPLIMVEPKLFWHSKCLKCEICQKFLEFDQTCHLLNGQKPICSQDFNKVQRMEIKQSKICFICLLPINKGQLRCFLNKKLAVHYSSNCLKCSVCERSIKPLEDIVVLESSKKIICSQHQSNICSSQDSLETLDPLGSFELEEENCQSPFCDSSTNLLLPHLKYDSPTFPNVLLDHNNLRSLTELASSSSYSEESLVARDSSNSNIFFHNPNSDSFSNGGKHTRMRTVLNESQLATLKACYAKNPRPDSITKEQLSFITGLSCRVIRVWFQNKRCKDKKRQLNEGCSHKSGKSFSGSKRS